MDAEDSNLLPWTTTKTGIDLDNKCYKHSLNIMRDITRSVISILKKKVKEEKYIQEDKIQSSNISNAITTGATHHLKSISKIDFNTNLICPAEVQPEDVPKTISVQYKLPIDKVEKAKDYFSVSTATDVGLYSFNYFYDNECE